MEENDPLIQHVITCLYSILKLNFKTLLPSNPQHITIYQNVKTIIIKCLEKYLTMKNPPKFITINIADCFSILILSGVFSNWTTCISDLIEESKRKNILIIYYIVLRALADINILIYYRKKYEEDDEDGEDIKLTQPLLLIDGERMKIKGELINNNKIVMKYIIDIYNIIKNINDNENLKKEFLYVILDTVGCWANFGINILKNNDIAQIIYFIMFNYEIERPEKFTDLILECISNSNNAKIYKDIEIEENSIKEQLSKKLFDNIDQNEIKEIYFLIEFIFKNLETFKGKSLKDMSEYQKKLFSSYLKIFSSIIENYVYLFFIFQEKSAKILEYFQYFITSRTRTISYLFIEDLGEMRNYINNFYRFSEENKEQSINYFKTIFFAVLENCTFNKLDINDISLLEKEILSKSKILSFSRQEAQINDYLYKNKFEEFDSELLDVSMSVEYYRNVVEDVFSNIFSILFRNFGEGPLISILQETLIVSLYQHENNALIVDVLFFVLSSISDFYDLNDGSKETKEFKTIRLILNVINDFLNKKIVIENQRIFVDLMVLINRYYSYFAREQNVFFNVIRFLFQIAIHTNNEKIEMGCYIILSNISNEKNENIQTDNNLIDDFFTLFKNKYQVYNYNQISPLTEIIKIIFSLLGINYNNSKKFLSEENIEFYKKIIQNISLPINQNIKELLTQYDSNSNNPKYKEILISEIKKSYIIQGKIISLLGEFNLEIKNYFVQLYLNNYLFLTEKIMHLFYANGTIMDFIYEFFENISITIGEKCQNNIDNICKLFIDFFISGKGHINHKLFKILKIIYLSLLESAEKNNTNYMKYNQYVKDKYILIIENLMEIISKCDPKNPSIKEKLRIFTLFHSEVFPKLLIDKSDIRMHGLIEKLIKFLIQCITVLQTLEKEVERTDERIIYPLINSFKSIFNNASFINSNNNVPSYIYTSAKELLKFVYFNRLNKTSRETLAEFYVIFMKYDMEHFCEIFKQLLIENNQKFNDKMIKEVLDYFIIFKEDKSACMKMIKIIIEIIKGDGDWNKFSNLLALSAKQKLK